MDKESQMERINQFITEFQNEELVKKYLYDHTWLSGSSTTVQPIAIWSREIEVQWKCDKRIFDRFIDRLVAKNSDLFKNGIFWKTDGSCPSRIILLFTDEFCTK